MSNLLKELDWQKQQADTLRTEVDRLRAALDEAKHYELHRRT
jgi:hypothetical protein